MITLIKVIFHIYKCIFQAILIVISAYFIILKYLALFIKDLTKIKYEDKKRGVKNESKSDKKTNTR